MTQITLYHLPNSRSQRILWLLEELKLDYHVVLSSDVDIDSIPDQLKPLKYPTIKINLTENEVFLTETSAIAEYLLAYFPNTLEVPPHRLNDFKSYIYWKNFADSSYMPNIALKQVFAQITQNTPLPFRPVSALFQYGFNKAYLNDSLNHQLRSINAHLGLKHNQFFGGSEFSLADILMWFPLRANIPMHNFSQLLLDKYPHIKSYLTQIEQRSEFIRSIQNGYFNNAKFDDYWNI